MDKFMPIWNKSKSNQELEDVLLYRELSKYAALKGEEAILLNDRLKEDPAYQQRPEQEKRILAELRKSGRKVTYANVRRSIYKASTRVALVFLCIFIAFSSTMFVSADFRKTVETVYRLLFNESERYTTLEANPATSGYFVDPELYPRAGSFIPTYIPAGYEYAFSTETDSPFAIQYDNKADGKSILYTQNDASSGVRIDSEDAEVQVIQIGESDAFLSVKNEYVILTWIIGDVFLSVETELSVDETIKIAEAIKYYK